MNGALLRTVSARIASRLRFIATVFAKEDYRALFEAIDQGFCTIEVLFDENAEPSDYRFLDVNRAFARHTGLHDAVGHRMRELAPTHEAHWLRIYGRVALTGEAAHFEHAAAALGRWYDVYAIRSGDPALRRVAVFFTDITSRKLVEHNLHASEARYRALAHATTNSVFRYNADGTELLEVYGGSVVPHPSSADPNASWVEDYVHPEDREWAREAWFSAVANGTTFELEVRGRLAGGSWGWLLARAVPLRDHEGAIVEWIGSATDITARRDADEALRRSEADHAAARREAEHANVAKDEFLAMLGHELRNPLAPMLTALQLMRLRGSASREQDVLERQVKHLTRMVDDLLDISRVTGRKIELRKQPIELCEVVIRALELAGGVLEERGDFVHVQVARAGLGIAADKDRMAQVLSNLLTNAAKYSEPGSRIIISARRLGDTVRVSVRDEGIGITPDMLASVFDAFVQQPQSLERSGGGLGLGLAIVRAFVAAHGGTVRAESAGVNRGSEFIVELPAINVPQAAVAGAATADAAAAGAGTRQKVLVVDDNRDAANMLQAALEQLGYVVDVAFDGPSALARAASFQPATVLLDIGLPAMDGYEVARRLRSRGGGAAMRLIAVTGYGMAADRQRAHDAGFDRHLVKPIDLHQLEHVLEQSPAGRSA